MSNIAKNWVGQYIKMKLYIGNSIYESTMYYPDGTVDGSKNKFIKSLNFSYSDGNNNVNPLGVMSSDRVTLVCYDNSCVLSPSNVNSPYYGQLNNGQKLELYLVDPTSNNLNGELYGIFYTTSFNDNYTDGAHDLTTIVAEDFLNILGNLEVPELTVYANISIHDLLTAVFTKIVNDGFPLNSIIFDQQVDTSYNWGVLPGTKIRDLLNSICQRTFSRIQAGKNNSIKFVPALHVNTDHNTIVLGPDDLSTLKNMTSSNVNFSKISVEYYKYGADEKAALYNKSELFFNIGHVTYGDIKFNDLVTCITNVALNFEDDNAAAIITNFVYQAYQDGMVIQFDLAGTNISDVEIYVEGYIANTEKLKQSIDIDTGSRLGLQEYIFECKMQLTDADALALCQEIKEYMDIIINKIQITDSIITPELELGDEVIIENTGTLYDGTYRVTEMQIDFSETYKNQITLLRIPPEPPEPGLYRNGELLYSFDNLITNGVFNIYEI